MEIEFGNILTVILTVSKKSFSDLPKIEIRNKSPFFTNQHNKKTQFQRNCKHSCLFLYPFFQPYLVFVCPCGHTQLYNRVNSTICFYIQQLQTKATLRKIKLVSFKSRLYAFHAYLWYNTMLYCISASAVLVIAKVSISENKSKNNCNEMSMNDNTIV